MVLSQEFRAEVLVASYTAHQPEVGAPSFGTQEQLSFLARVCLAEMLAEDGERQVLVLDDSLVHTDPERLGRAVSLLREVAGKVQVLLFSCHPERFAGFGAVEVRL